MPLLAVGINHRTAPVHVREQVAFGPEQLPASLQQLAAAKGVQEAAILSTCNRTEIYCALDTDQTGSVVRWLGDHHALDQDEFRKHLYAHPDAHAVRHLLRVASGLDSMVLGEPQILGQVKSAYQNAASMGTLGNQLDRLFQHSFAVAKKIRTDTSIGASPVSVAFAAVGLTRQIFDDLQHRTALLIGAGDTVELVARHLAQQRIGRVIVANRTLERAHQLATRFGGLAITLEEIAGQLSMADMVVSSTASSEPVLRRASLETALKARKHRPMLIIDLAVPRDVEGSVSVLEDVYLYTIDDLESIIAENMRTREEAAEQAEEIIDAQVDRFLAWQRSLDAVEAIRSLRHWAETTREAALHKAQRQLAAGHEPSAVMEQFARQLTNKLIHKPCLELREAGAEGREEVIEIVKALYQQQDPSRE